MRILAVILLVSAGIGMFVVGCVARENLDKTLDYFIELEESRTLLRSTATKHVEECERKYGSKPLEKWLYADQLKYKNAKRVLGE